MASFGVGPNPYKSVTSDELTQEKWDQAIRNLVQPNYKRLESQLYDQAAQGNGIVYQNNKTNYTNNPQQVLPFPGTWQGGEEPAIVSPYMDWDKQVWIVTKVDGEGMGWPRGVFSKETEAEKFAAAINCDQYEYIDVTPFELDQEVVVDEPKK